MWDLIIRWSCYIITCLFPIIPSRNSETAWPTLSLQCFLAKNSSSHNLAVSGYKTTMGFHLIEVGVKGDRDITNSSASCLSQNTSTP